MESGQARNPGQRPRPQQRRGSSQRPRRRKRRYTLHYLLLFLFCLGLGFALCVNVLFKVQVIKVEGNETYSSQEIISRSGIQKEDKLFFLDKSDTERMLEDRFPYLQSVEIKRRLPTTVLIKVKEEIPLGAAYTDEGYVLLSRTGKVLEQGLRQAPESLPVLLGLEEQKFSVGSYLYEPSTERGSARQPLEKLQLILRFVDQAASQGLGDLTYISVNDLEEIEALYDGRILIRFGGELDLERKITFVLKVLEAGIADNHPLSGYTNETFEGTIDITDRKQLRTRAMAVETVADLRAFTVFEEEPEELPPEETPEESPEETLPEGEASSPDTASQGEASPPEPELP